VLIDFSSQVKCSVVRKRDAWKEARVRVDPVKHQHVDSEVSCCGYSLDIAGM
jgi:hypothetical protein